jgi:hypothetical protein
MGFVGRIRENWSHEDSLALVELLTELHEALEVEMLFDD